MIVGIHISGQDGVSRVRMVVFLAALLSYFPLNELYRGKVRSITLILPFEIF